MMVDMPIREALMRDVHRRLASAEFARQLPVTADDGTKPFTIAMHEDAVSRLMGQVVTLGGAANVVVPIMWSSPCGEA